MTNPLPYSCTVLVLVLPGVILLGRRLTDWMFETPEVRQVVAPFAALGPWMVAVATAGRAAGSFVTGLFVGTLACALAGVVWTWRRRGAPRTETPPSGARTLVVVTVAFLATIPVAWLSLSSDFFDDLNLIGHRSMVSQLQNDSYPPRHQVYPDYPLRYHFGFNLVAASLTAMLRLSVSLAIDVVLILGFFGSVVLAWRLGERLTSGSGFWTVLGGLLTGGVFHWFSWYADWAQHSAVGVVIGGNRTNFPVIMYFFQKPFALGFPLALAVVLTATVSSSKENAWRRGLLLSLLLGPLSLAQVVLFVTVGASLAAQELWEQRRLRAVAPFALALGLAVPLGGVLFTFLPEASAGLLRPRFWLTNDPPLEVLAWLGLTTGLLIPLGLLGTLWMKRLRVFFTLLIVGSFGVLFFFYNPQAWDIVKFSTVGQLAAGLASGTLLARVAGSKLRFRGAVLGALISLLVLSPAAYFATWAKEVVWPTPALGDILAAQREPERNPHWLHIIDWLRRNGASEGIVYAAHPLLERRLLLAGLYTAGPHGGVNPQFGVAPERIERRRRLLEELPPRPGPWLEEGIDWFVTGPGDPMQPTLDAWVAGRLARYEAVTGGWSVYRLIPLGPRRSSDTPEPR